MRKLFWCLVGFVLWVNLDAQKTVQFITPSSIVAENIDSFQVFIGISNPDSLATIVDVNVAVGGTAVSGIDFNYSPHTIVFPPDSNNVQTVTVYVIDNYIPDGDKSFTFRLTSDSAVIGADSLHTVTIFDTDTQHISISPASEFKLETDYQTYVHVTLDHANINLTQVDLVIDTLATTAVAGIDYTGTFGRLTWLDSTAGTIDLHIIFLYHFYWEPDRILKLKLINATNGAVIGDSIYTLTIHQGDYVPDCSQLYFSQYIQGSGNNQALQIYNPTNQTVDLSQYIIQKTVFPGAQGQNYYLSGMLAPGDVFVGANPLADSRITSQADALDSFFITDGTNDWGLFYQGTVLDEIGILGQYNGPSGWGITQDTTIIRNYYAYSGTKLWFLNINTWDTYSKDMFDSIGFHHTAPCGTAAIPTIDFVNAIDTVPDSTFVQPVAIRITNPGPQTDQNSQFRIEYQAILDEPNTDAAIGVDYNFSNIRQQHVFPHGISFDTLQLSVIGNTLVQPTRKVALKLIDKKPDFAQMQDSTYSLYIVNNNKLTASFYGAGYSYVEDTPRIEVKLTLSSYYEYPVSVSVTLAPGNATPGVDFWFNDTTITFPAFSLDTQGVWITLIDDTIVEGNEQINLDMHPLTDAVVLGNIAYTITIIDNDYVPTGIDAIEKDEQLRIFPNPASDILNVTIKENEKFVIKDALGNEVVNYDVLKAGTNQLNISTLPSGLYLCIIESATGKVGKRFVKTE